MGAIDRETAPAIDFDLIETMAFDPEAGLPLLEHHLARLTRSAAELGFRFDRHGLRNELQTVTFGLMDRARVRVMLGQGGEMAVEVRGHRDWPEPVIAVCIQPRGLAADDLRLRHKTSARGCYEDALRAGGTFEVLLVDDDGFLTEGCFTNIFVERGDRLVTPPLVRGLLPGVLRASLLDQGEAVEGELREADLAEGFFIGNAARGLVAARLVAPRGRPSSPEAHFRTE